MTNVRAAGKAHRTERLALIVLRGASGFFIVSIALLIGYLAVEGTKLFTVDHKSIFEFLFSPTFAPDQGHIGALAFILGSLFVTAFAIAVGGPFGVAVGVFAGGAYALVILAALMLPETRGQELRSLAGEATS